VFEAGALLNLFWVGLCICAITLQLRSDSRRSANRRSRIRGGIVVFLAVVALFPCVSATDDSIRVEYLDSQQQPSSGAFPEPSHDKSLGTLVRLFEVLESAQIVFGLIIAATLFFFALVSLSRPASIDRLMPALSGRAPPTCDFAL
jgi:hypothetical protein